MGSVRIGLAQVNPVVGDLVGNRDLIVDVMAEAEGVGCDLVALPELAITGYPPEDLLLRPSFVQANLEILDEIVARSGRCVAFVGFVDVDPDRRGRRSEGGTDTAALHNAVAVCAHGELIGTYRKRRLPNYSVFDEQRYFVPGDEPFRLYRIAGVLVGVSICEDAWVADGPVADLARGGAELVVNVNASPYHAGKRDARQRTLLDRAREVGRPLAYVNQVGGQDELVFDGDSMVVAADGTVLARAPQFVEMLAVVDVDVDVPTPAGSTSLPVTEVRSPARVGRLAVAPIGVAVAMTPEAEVWEALVVGTRDFVRKNGFQDVVVGLSGGIDSALVATIAVDAIGADHVHGVLMPSRYSSAHSVADAEALARNLGIEHRVVPIEAAHAAFMEMLASSFGADPPGLTEENLQSRLRAVVLMGLSNAFGWLLLNTGNKSEASVGYSTLYGDSAGGFAVIKDVGKLGVYRLCRYRNERAGSDLIPESTLDKPPSAELRPDQRDDQSLPAYEVLDPILTEYVEHDRSPDEIVASGFDADLVARIVGLVDRAEFKRRQAPPGPRVTTKGFGKDRRLPITNRYKG